MSARSDRTAARGVMLPVAARAAALAILLLLPGVPLAAQQQDWQRNLRDSQSRLDSIRDERTRLQREMDDLQSRVRDASAELQNISRQRNASLSALQELDFQHEMLTEQIEEASTSLGTTRARLRARTEQMNARLRSIYKRGRMHAVRVLLSAESFGDLLNRYKYLHMMSSYERSMVAEIGRLERSLFQHEESLRASREQLDQLRAEKQSEVAALQQIESQQNRVLREYRQQATETSGVLDRLVQDEAVLAEMFRDLERRRTGSDALGRSPAVSALHARMLGTLPWPVDGDVIYRFGLVRRPNNVVIRHNGIGIAAPLGTPVRAVESGTVTMARSLDGYGPAVMLSHGGGYYTLYLHLRSISVREGQEVGAADAVGTLGGERTAEGPHIEFRVLVPLQGGPPQPVDPLDWLRSRGGR